MTNYIITADDEAAARKMLDGHLITTAVNYAPCRHGIHVCGASADEMEPVTVANFPRASKAMFDSLKGDFAVDGEDFDLVVDFMCDGDILQDFRIRRQSLAAIQAMISVEAT